MTLINIHFTIQDLTPRYPFLQHGTNLIPVRNQIAAVVLSSLTTLEQMLDAIRPRRARRYLSKRPGLVPAVAADVISGTASASASASASTSASSAGASASASSAGASTPSSDSV